VTLERSKFEQMDWQALERYRGFLKSLVKTEWDGSDTDRKKRLPAPPLQKLCPENSTVIDLIDADRFSLGKMDVIEALRHRKSRRKYTQEPLTLEEISYLLWATQGVRDVVRSKGKIRYCRTAPSSGSCYPYETYILANRIEGVEVGMYRYLPLDHLLCFLYREEDLVDKVHQAFLGQFIRDSAAVFIWTAIPYRAEWRYGMISHKVVLVEAGHICQNLYLACESIGIGTCALGAYDQESLDKILRVDGRDEFAVYAAVIGKIENDIKADT
jgi:SagB-type dehydrogenase family enzyme